MQRSLTIISIISAFIIFIGFLGFISPNNESNLVIYFPPGKDFPNPEQGRMVMEFRFPPTDFKVGDKIADTLLFLDSETIPGLKILYNQKEKKVYAGIPLLATEEIFLMDGNDHKLEYTFHREQKQQAIFLDGNLMASGVYGGDVTILTGYAIYRHSKYAESYFPMEVSFE